MHLCMCVSACTCACVRVHAVQHSAAFTVTAGGRHTCIPQAGENIAAGKDGPGGIPQTDADSDSEAIAAHYPTQVCATESNAAL